MTPYELSERAKALVTLSGLSDLIENEMRHVRSATIKECAKVAETFYDGLDPTLTAGRAAAAKAISRSIRSLTQPNLGKE